jgi:hypothetical protein
MPAGATLYQGFVAPSKFMNTSVSLVAESNTFRSSAAVSSTVLKWASMPSKVPLVSARRCHSPEQCQYHA